VALYARRRGDKKRRRFNSLGRTKEKRAIGSRSRLEAEVRIGMAARV
jgi:hypothetical protein